MGRIQEHNSENLRIDSKSSKANLINKSACPPQYFCRMIDENNLKNKGK